MVNGHDSMEHLADQGAKVLLDNIAEQDKLVAVWEALNAVTSLAAEAGYSLVAMVDAGGRVNMIGCGTPVSLMGLCAYGQGRVSADMAKNGNAV